MASARPKDLPFTALNSYGQVKYGLRFLYQLWPLWVAALWFQPLVAHWQQFAHLALGPVAALFLWLCVIVKPTAAVRAPMLI